MSSNTAIATANDSNVAANGSNASRNTCRVMATQRSRTRSPHTCSCDTLSKGGRKGSVSDWVYKWLRERDTNHAILNACKRKPK